MIGRGLFQVDDPVRPGTDDASRQPHRCDSARGGILITHLPSDQQTACSGQLLIIGKRGTGSRRYVRHRAWTSGTVCKFQHYFR